MVYGRRRKAIGRMVQKKGGTYMVPKSAAKAVKKLRENFEESHAHSSQPVGKGHQSESSLFTVPHYHGDFEQGPYDRHEQTKRVPQDKVEHAGEHPGVHAGERSVGHAGGHGHAPDSKGAGLHSHSHIPAGTNEKVVMIGFLLTFGFMLVEFVGGYISGSLALMADAGHMLIDASALALAWAGFYFGKKPINAQKTFGYLRLEVLAALFNSLFLFGLTLWVGYEAVMRITRPTEIMAGSMFIVAVLGLLVNALVFYILNKGEKDHLNIKGALLHVMGDLLGSVAAIGAAVVIYFTGWSPIDSILSIFVCLLILKNVWRLFKNAFDILMEGVPGGIDISKIKQRVLHVRGVKSVCHIHVWALTSGKVMATLNISVKNERHIISTVKAVKRVLTDEFGIVHATVGVDETACVLEEKEHFNERK